MFSAAIRNQFRRATVQTVRSASSSSHPKPLIPASILSRWYATFGKSNAAYLSWIIMGVLVGEALTGVATDALWNSINYGKTYDTVDWSKFVVADDDDDEEEEEEEEGGDEDEEDGDDDDE